jgi:hypothetical protein
MILIIHQFIKISLADWAPRADMYCNVLFTLRYPYRSAGTFDLWRQVRVLVREKAHKFPLLKVTIKKPVQIICQTHNPRHVMYDTHLIPTTVYYI